MSEATEGATKGLGVFTTLEAATKAKFCILATTFLLLLDNVFIKLGQPTVFQIASSSEVMAQSNLAIKSLLIYVLFSFVTSILLPPLAIFFDQVLSGLIIRIALIGSSNISGKNETRPLGCVYLSELREEAHKTKDKYYLDLYNEYNKKRIEKKANAIQLTFYIFYCMSMLCWNYYLGHAQEDAISIVVAKYIGDKDYVYVPILVLFYMFFRPYFQDEKPQWVYCPTLYKKHQDL